MLRPFVPPQKSRATADFNVSTLRAINVPRWARTNKPPCGKDLGLVPSVMGQPTKRVTARLNRCALAA